MNIGGYRPDGNIMTVPEIKEIVTEGVDISDLKDKVDTIQGAVGELETGLNTTISDLNTTKGNVETLTTAVNTLDTELSETSESVATNTEDIATNATDIETLQTNVTALNLNKVGKYVAGDEISYVSITCAGYITNASKDIELFIPDNRIDGALSYTISDFAMTTRYPVGGYGYVMNDNNFLTVGPTPLPFITDSNKVISSLDNIVITKKETGLVVRVKLTNAFYAHANTTDIVVGNTPVAVSINAKIVVS